jgi:hypothetical protein
MYAELAPGVAHRTMTTQDLNIPDVSAGPDGLHAALPRQDSGNGSFLLFQGVNSPNLNEVLALPANASSSDVHGLAFTLANFSNAGLGSAEFRLPGFDALPREAQRSSFWSDTAKAVGLGEDFPLETINFEETTRPSVSPGKAPEQPEQWRPQLAPRLEVQPENHKSSHEENGSPVKSQAEGLWQTSSGLLESPRFDRSGSLGSTTLWDLDERLGWLLLGMFMTPPTELRGLSESEDRRRVPARIR